MSEVKQVIVMRTDLNMRKGKMIAQGAHAAMSFLTYKNAIVKLTLYGGKSVLHAPVTEAQREWLENSFTKVCVRVDSEEELLSIVAQAGAAKLPVHLIQDSGKTEFHGEPTYTCCAIGPDWADEIDKVTGGLKLL